MSGLTCTTITYPLFSFTPYNIGASPSVLDYSSCFGWIGDGSSLCKLVWYNSGSLSYDKVSLYDPSNADYWTWTHVSFWTFTGWINAGVSTTLQSDLELVDAGNPSSIAVSITRTGSVAPMNYVAIKTSNQWFNALSSNFKNVVANVDFLWVDGIKRTYPLIWSWGIAVAATRFPSVHAKISLVTGDVTFTGFEVGYTSSGTVSKTSCSNKDFNCIYNQQYPGTFTCDSSLNPSGSAQWTCLVQSGICSPVAWTTPFFDWNTASWTSIYSAVNSSGTVVGLKYVAEDIFSCSETWLSVLVCPFQILGKVWWKFTAEIQIIANLIYWASSIGSPKWNGEIISLFLPTILPRAYADDLWASLTTPFNTSNTGWSSNAYTGVDMMGINKSILKMGDNVALSSPGWIKGVFAWSQWTLIVLWLFTVLVLFLVAFA